MARFNQIHITMCIDRKRQIINECGDYEGESLLKDIQGKKTGKLNGDNLDITITSNDVRNDHKFHEKLHYFVSNFAIDRVAIDNNRDELVDHQVNKAANIETFIVNERELLQWKNSLRIVLSRVMTQYLPEFSWIKQVFEIFYKPNTKS